jgi:hypothetical protein
MNNLKHHGRRVLTSMVALLAAIILILWGWNSAIPDLFGLPSMHFKQAMGLTVFAVVLPFILHLGTRHCRDKDTNSYHKESIWR